MLRVQLFLTETPDITPGAEERKRDGPTELRSEAGDLTVATYNIENFPGRLNAETEERLAEIAEQVATLLGSPAVVALQEQQVRARACTPLCRVCRNACRSVDAPEIAGRRSEARLKHRVL